MQRCPFFVVFFPTMKFRPCIDLHSGRVKQIVGGTLDATEKPRENFVSEQRARVYCPFCLERGTIISSMSSGQISRIVGDFCEICRLSAAHYAAMYKRDALQGGHVIMLGKGNDAAAAEAVR